MAFLLVFACVFTIILSRSRSTDPVYNGKRLSVWLSAYSSEYCESDRDIPPTDEEAEVDRAFRALGTNAIPCLIRILKQKDSPIKVFLCDHGFGKPASAGYKRAGRGLRALEPTVSAPAIPALIEILSDPDPSWTSPGETAAIVLVHIGVASVPELTHALTNSSFCVQARAAWALTKIGEAAEPALPALIKLLKSPNERTRRVIAVGLGRIGKRPDLIVPALAESLTDKSATVRSEIVASLEKFGRQAEPAGPALGKLLETGQISRDEAFSMSKTLVSIAPNEALKHLEPMLKLLLRENVAANEIEGLLERIPNGTNTAIPIISQYLSECDFDRDFRKVLSICRVLGSNARAILPRLQAAAEDLLSHPGGTLYEYRVAELAVALYWVGPEETRDQVVKLVMHVTERPKSMEEVIRMYDGYFRNGAGPFFESLSKDNDEEVQKFAAAAQHALELKRADSTNFARLRRLMMRR